MRLIKNNIKGNINKFKNDIIKAIEKCNYKVDEDNLNDLNLEISEVLFAISLGISKDTLFNMKHDYHIEEIKDAMVNHINKTIAEVLQQRKEDGLSVK